MKTAMRSAFEAIKVPTHGKQSLIVEQIVRVAGRQDQRLKQRRAAAKRAKKVVQ